MERVAILTCLKACRVCTGASCLGAWNRRKGGFARYAGEDAALAAFFHCNGCGSDPESDAGMLEKLDRLQEEGVSVVHTGICTVTDRESMSRCPAIEKIADMLARRGMTVVHGTH